MQETLRLGANAVLRKPVSPDVLLRRVRAVLDGKDVEPSESSTEPRPPRAG